MDQRRIRIGGTLANLAVCQTVDGLDAVVILVEQILVGLFLAEDVGNLARSQVDRRRVLLRLRPQIIGINLEQSSVTVVHADLVGFGEVAANRELTDERPSVVALAEAESYVPCRYRIGELDLVFNRTVSCGYIRAIRLSYLVIILTVFGYFKANKLGSANAVGLIYQAVRGEIRKVFFDRSEIYDNREILGSGVSCPGFFVEFLGNATVDEQRSVVGILIAWCD